VFTFTKTIKKIWSINPSLSALVVYSLICLAVSVSGLCFDHRHINNEHAWIKPCKFSISFTLYGLTMTWLGQYLLRHRKFFHGTCIAALIGGVLELSAIVLQVLRGTTSHFNTGTPFDHSVFILVKVAIMPVALAVVAIFILLLRQKELPPVVGSALHWAVFLTIVGLIPGILMILPDPLQDAITQYKQFDGHTVGFPEGGPGLPWLGWSTVAGDLRIAHFVGIHALQVLPLIGFAIMKLLPSLSTQRQRTLVWNAGLTYLSAILLLTWQALQAESIIAASPATITVAILIGIASISGAMFTILIPHQFIEIGSEILHEAEVLAETESV
jgi:hypothetical protein